MPGTPPLARPLIVFGAVLLGWLLVVPGESRADRITLRGGGQVRGKLIADKARPDVLLFIGEVGKTPMVFKKDQVVQVVAEKSPLDEYVVLRAQERSTAQAEHELGLWCEEHGLADLAQVHYESAVKRDSTFGPSHQKLGHVQRDGRWLNADELKEAQGLVKYKGHWITPEEKERKEALVATAAEGASWAKRIKLLRDSYLAGPDERSREAERRLLAIEEPVAVSPVLRVLGEDPIPALRGLAARILGGIPGSSASTGLVGRLMAEADQGVREVTMTEVARRDQAEVVPILIRALRSASPDVVNRAAWCLGNLNAVMTVPKLVPALITIENRVVMTTDAGNAPSGNFGVSFNAVSPAPGVNNYGGASIPVLTPPVVGPGVVAFGATSVPYGAFNGPSLSVGGGGGGSRGPTPRLVAIEHHNSEVLAALIKMTGRDFGYDIPTWKRWVATSFRIEEAPSRRVPQP
jgi:HEAT repeats